MSRFVYCIFILFLFFYRYCVAIRSPLKEEFYDETSVDSHSGRCSKPHDDDEKVDGLLALKIILAWYVAAARR